MSGPAWRPWTAHLACGCTGRTAGQPREGSWITCTARPAHGQRKVTGVRFEPEPREVAAGVQGELFGRPEAAA